jgi:hypothetical protein
MENYEDNDDANILDENIRAELRKSRQVAKEAAEANAKLAELQKELAFTKAGIPEDGVGALLRKAYDGEVTPEAIRAAASQYGISSGTSASTSTGEIPQSELDGMRRVNGAAVNAGGTPPVDAGNSFLSELANANTEAEAFEVVKKYGESNPELGFYARGAYN